MTLKLRLDDILERDELKDLSKVVEDLRAIPPPSGYELQRRSASIHGEYIGGETKYFIHVKERVIRADGETKTISRSFAYASGHLIDTDAFRKP